MFNEPPRRKRLRLPDRTYEEGAYHVTVCTLDHHPILGNVIDGNSKLNEIGLIVERKWLRLERNGIILDEHIVMPNHIHGIVAIEKTSGTTLPKLMRAFKSQAVKSLQISFRDKECRMWQRGYYETSIVGAEHLAQVREYIRANPQNWDSDEYRTRDLE